MEGAQERISSVPAACPGSCPVPNINMYAIYMSYFSSIRWVKTSKQAKKNGGRDMTDPNPANLQQPNFAPVGSECMPDRTPELSEVEMSKKCTPLWREAHFQVKMYKTPQLRTTFGSCDVEKVHAVVARSTFPSQNVQNTRGSDHFWKLWCRKSARRCGAKHISKSKCTKHTILGPLLEVQMSKKCLKSARRCGAKHISKSKV